MPSALFINRVYPPARGATGYVLENMAKRLVEQGWQISVVSATTSPRASDGITIYTPKTLGKLAEKVPRAFGGYPLSLLALLVGALRAPKHDIVVSLTDPPLVAVISLLVRFIKGSKILHWSQDVYPDVLENVIGNCIARAIARLLKKPYRLVIAKHDAVVAIGNCMAKQLAEPKSAGISALVVRNPYDSTIKHLPRATDELRKEFGIKGKFTVVYAGNAGKAHTFDTLLMTAFHMQKTYPDITFAIVGAGSVFSAVQATAEKTGLNNVHFIPWVPDEKLSAMLAVADVHITTMSDKVLDQIVPSRVAGIFAAARPCIFVGPEECDAAELIIRNNCGQVVKNGSIVALANSIGHFYENPELWKQASANALAAARKYYDATKLAKDFSDIMLDVLRRGES